MQTVEKAITFRVPATLKERFEEAAKAEHRSMTGALVNLMEQRVAEHKAEQDREPTPTTKAAA